MALSTIQNNSFADTAVHGYRNLVTNGGLIVSQRGDYTSATSYTGENYYLDRWKMWINTVTGTVQQTTVTINGVTKKAMKIVATSSGTGYIGTRQIIELQNIPVGVNVVASCWVRSNNANTRLRANDFVNGSDGNSPDLTNDGNWERVSWSFDSTGTTVNPSIGIITFDTSPVSVTSGDYIEFTDYQLEIGSKATPFEHRSYGDELARCQRYYQQVDRGSGIASTSSIAYISIPYIKTMRAVPSFGTTGGLGMNDARVNTIQSTAQITAYNANLSGSFTEMRNFSGLTQYSAVLMRGHAGTFVTLDAEL